MLLFTNFTLKQFRAEERSFLHTDIIFLQNVTFFFRWLLCLLSFLVGSFEHFCVFLSFFHIFFLKLLNYKVIFHINHSRLYQVFFKSYCFCSSFQSSYNFFDFWDLFIMVNFLNTKKKSNFFNEKNDCMRKTTVTNVENNMVVQKFEKKTWKKLMKTQIKIWNYWQWKESRQRSLRYKKEENCHVLKENNWELLRNPASLGPNLWTLRNPATCKFKLVYFKLWAQTCEVLKPSALPVNFKK